MPSREKLDLCVSVSIQDLKNIKENQNKSNSISNFTHLMSEMMLESGYTMTGVPTVEGALNYCNVWG